MRLLKWALGLLLATATQVIGMRLSADFSAFFDPFLVLVVFQSLGGSLGWNIVGGSAIGLCQDSLSGGLFGLHGFANTVVTYVCSRLQQQFVFQQPLQVGLLFCFAAALQVAILCTLQFLLVHGGELPGPASMIGKILTTGLAGLGLYLLSLRFKSWERGWRRQRQSKVKLGAR